MNKIIIKIKNIFYLPIDFFKWVRVILKIKKENRVVYRKSGIHCFIALMGGGKTMLANLIIHSYLKENEFFFVNDRAFVNAEEKGKAIFLDYKKLFENGDQVYQLPLKINDRKCAGIIIDEVNLDFNRRDNKRKDYNDIFMGLIKAMITLRHQGIPRIYYLTQSHKLIDVQLDLLIKFKHYIVARRRWSWSAWKYDYKAIFIPKRLKVLTFMQNQSTAEFEPFSSQKHNINYLKHVKTYDHRARSRDFKKLPILPLK